MGGPVRCVLVGLGHRTACYAQHALDHPDELQVVAIADPDPVRRARFQAKFSVPDAGVFEDAAALAAAAPEAEIAINGTMDEIHIETSIPLLRAGYHLLLEKPITGDADELAAFEAVAKETNRIVLICHVLRHAPFWAAIKARVAAGEVGEILHMRTMENVSYHHMAVAFVRGKWRRREVNPMLLAKCCHDLDLICWMKSGCGPTRVSSFGGRHFFTPERAPAGAGERCTDCAIEADCVYSARQHYAGLGWWPFYALAGNPTYEAGEELTPQDKEAWLASSPYGRCVWHCDNDVVDQQSLMVEFDDGSLAVHQMVSNAARATRQVHIIGTAGEIEGDMERGTFTVRKPMPAANPALDGDGPRASQEFTEEVVDVAVAGDLHGGGDARLVVDLIALIRGREPSLSTTALSDSLNSHRIAYAADESMREGHVVHL